MLRWSEARWDHVWRRAAAGGGVVPSGPAEKLDKFVRESPMGEGAVTIRADSVTDHLLWMRSS